MSDEWMMNKGMKEWINEWINEYMNKGIEGMNKLMNE